MSIYFHKAKIICPRNNKEYFMEVRSTFDNEQNPIYSPVNGCDWYNGNEICNKCVMVLSEYFIKQKNYVSFEKPFDPLNL